MNDLSEVEQTLVDAQAFFQSDALIELSLTIIGMSWTKVVRDLFASGQVDKVQEAVALKAAIVFGILTSLERCDMKSK
jgi:hypothetical protein